MSESTSKLFETETKEEVKDEVPAVVNAPVDDIQDIDLSIIEKKRFRINGDNNRIVELNTSDLLVLNRLETGYARLTDLVEKVGKKLENLPDSIDSEKDAEELKSIEESISELDSEMRVQIDYIFDSNVSDICAPSGSMWDPIGGSFRYEHIIETLVKLYADNLANEFSAMKARMNKHTAKYKKTIAKSKYHK